MVSSCLDCWQYDAQIGGGAFGVVYRVRNDVGVLKALKEFCAETCVEYKETEIGEFLNLLSPRIVKPECWGMDAAGRLRVVTEFLPNPLRPLLGPLPLDEKKVIWIFEEILKGLVELEHHGFVHGNLKPSDIFLSGENVKIGDAWIPLFVRGLSPISVTPSMYYNYCAPERFNRKYDSSVDRWAAAVILYEMLSGVRPFPAPSLSDFMQAIMNDDPDFSIIPDKYFPFLFRCFMKDPAAREENHPSAEAMLDDFRWTCSRKAVVAKKRTSQSVTGPEPGNPWSDPATGMEFVWIPQGEFMMGSADDAQDAFEDEKPSHLVVFSRGFWMSKYPVTASQFYRHVLGGALSNTLHEFNHPVRYVSWKRAQDFVRWLNDQPREEIVNFSLPTEAQWEYACRAGTTTRFYWGEECEPEHAAFGLNASVPVGSFPPNPWGLHDMLGNVWEWCLDTYDGNAYSRHAEIDPVHVGAGENKVIRGGGWDTRVGAVGVARRGWFGLDGEGGSLGFRVVVL